MAELRPKAALGEAAGGMERALAKRDAQLTALRAELEATLRAEEAENRSSRREADTLREQLIGSRREASALSAELKAAQEGAMLAAAATQV